MTISVTRHVFLYGAILNRVHLGRMLLYLGYADEAQGIAQESLRVAEKMRHPVGLCNALSVAVAIEVFHRNAEKITDMAEKMLFHADEHGLPHYAGIGTIMRGWARAMRGEVAEGIAEMREGLAANRAVETEQQRANYLVLMAEALCKAGQIEEGLRTLDEAAEAINNTGEHLYEAELYHIKGELLIKSQKSEEQNPQSEAAVCFQKAIDVARRQSAKAFELRAAIGLARLWQRQGKTAQAHRLLADNYGWFTEGFDTSDLKEAKALLAQLGRNP